MHCTDTHLQESPQARPEIGAPLRVFSWDIHLPGDARIGACGASHDRCRAYQDCADALRAAPAGSVGFVDGVTLDSSGKTAYDYGSRIASGWFDPSAGAVVWAE